MKRQIPNMLSVLRLCMIPAFVICYFKYTAGWRLFTSLCIYAIAWATDALDGYLARRNNWITDLGKFLDPLADKLMQLAAALCFTMENKVFLLVTIPLILKEACMLWASVRIKNTKNIVVGSNWYGKLATFLLFVCAFTRMIVRHNPILDIIIAVAMLACMIFSLLMYYFKDFKGKYKLDLFS